MPAARDFTREDANSLQAGHPLKLPSPIKLARLGHFPPASQAGRLAGPEFYVYVFSLVETIRLPLPGSGIPAGPRRFTTAFACGPKQTLLNNLLFTRPSSSGACTNRTPPSCCPYPGCGTERSSQLGPQWRGRAGEGNSCATRAVQWTSPLSPSGPPPGRTSAAIPVG
jgi:hypothetical protein